VEILAALLTAVTYWLFWFVALKGRRARLRDRAGSLLCDKRRCCRRWYWTLALAIIIPALVFSRPAMLVYLSIKLNDSFLLHGVFSWNSPMFIRQWLLTILYVPFLFFLFPQWLEFRERAALVCQGPLTYLLRWTRVMNCKMSDVPGRLQIRLRAAKYEIDLSGGEAESVLAALASVVETRDRSGDLVHPEIQAQRQELAAKNPIPPWRFQFDLRTMLLFVLFASAAMSWYGVRYHRDEAERAALARLDPFKPSVMGQPYMLWIDFSSSPVKPGDDDLALLSDLARLDDLGLAGSPITDAGLVHLERLKFLHDLDLSHTAVSDAGLEHLEKLRSLRRVVLRHSRVTSAGVERLKRALPSVEVVN
jgi:hypothetical protein